MLIIVLKVVMLLQDGSVPIKYGLALDMEDRCSAVPARLARLAGVPPQNMVLVDIIQSQVTNQSIRLWPFCTLSLVVCRLSTRPHVCSLR